MVRHRSGKGSINSSIELNFDRWCVTRMLLVTHHPLSNETVVTLSDVLSNSSLRQQQHTHIHMLPSISTLLVPHNTTTCVTDMDISICYYVMTILFMRYCDIMYGMWSDY